MSAASEAKDKFARFKRQPFRPGQEEAITDILEGTRKVTVVVAPTGTGKSLIGMAAGATYDKACYLCSSKQLQYQLTSDFKEAEYMMGKNNFPCGHDLTRSADLCLHTRMTPCKGKARCPYEIHKRRVLAHPLQILNFAYLLNESNYVGKFSGYPLIVSDEADVLEGLLTGFIELSLSRARLESLGLTPPRRKTATAKDGLAAWREWAEQVAQEKLAVRMAKLQRRIARLSPDDSLSPEDMRAIQEYRALESLAAKLQMFSAHMDDTWIFQESERQGKVERWVFQPTWLTPALSEEYFFRHGARHVLMSATFPPKAVLAATLGLQTGDIEYIELPSTFPAANRPVLLHPVADMAMKSFEGELPKLLRGIENILAKHPREKGMIHTTSWRLNAAVMSLNLPRLVSHNGSDKDRALEAFRGSRDGVFVSPSSMRGVDLPDDDCRFIIISKAPFQSLGDKLVSSRVYGSGLGAFWYRAIAAQDIVQASGRGVRHAGDYCTTYLLDRQIERLL
ncbi:MAG TPA: helicase C-terminal domain-containing protein, partial [Candidatus Acidoferrum sp.]|nr:helicase C-terminal domain-containing protein [Candidatus Acidoferrum sp.]